LDKEMMEMNKGSSSEEVSTIQKEQLARACESHVKIFKLLKRFCFLNNCRCKENNATIERESLESLGRVKKNSFLHKVMLVTGSGGIRTYGYEEQNLCNREFDHKEIIELTSQA
jgi:hypothetical protein